MFKRTGLDPENFETIETAETLETIFHPKPVEAIARGAAK
jgi:hypothetical protein